MTSYIKRLLSNSLFSLEFFLDLMITVIATTTIAITTTHPTTDETIMIVCVSSFKFSDCGFDDDVVVIIIGSSVRITFLSDLIVRSLSLFSITKLYAFPSITTGESTVILALLP